MTVTGSDYHPDVVIEAELVPYGTPATRALHAAVTELKGGDPLAPVTVIVPANSVGVAARRQLGSGVLGPLSRAGPGLAAVTFSTAHRLGELLGAPLLAESRRRPVSAPVIAAAVRRVLRNAPGVFAPVAGHPTTERSLVRAHRELREVGADGLRALSARGRRAAEVVRVHRAVSDALSADWYDEVDVLSAATDAVASGTSVLDDLGPFVVYLPQQLRPSAAALIGACAAHSSVRVIAGTVGSAAADRCVMRSLELLGVEPPERGALAPVAADRVTVVDTSDADDEVRQVVRGIVDAARHGVALERIAVLYGASDPYARIVDEQLAAAGIDHNGAAVQTAATSLLGRSVLALLALPDRDFRRDEILAWLESAPVLDQGRPVPAAAWDRVSRRAGVVGGAAQWSARLTRHADDLGADADRLAADAEGRARRLRREAEWARSLGVFVDALVDALDPGAAAASWRSTASWVRRLVITYFGSERRRDDWPEVERRAAERIEAALERLGGLDLVDDPPSLAVFRRTLELELESGLGRVGRLGEGVLTGHLDLALGVDLDEVFVVGVAEGSLPSRGREDSLLPDRDRLVVDELVPRGERVDDEHRLLLAAVASAERVTLSYPRGDLRRSVERVPSRWIDEIVDLAASVQRRTVPSFAAGVASAEFPATDQEHNLQRLAADGADAGAFDPVIRCGFEMIRARASDAFTRFDGNLAGARVPAPTDPGVVSSPTRLEAWARCPFEYFVQHVLHIQPIDRPEALLQLSPLDRGNIVHAALEQLVAEVLARPESDRPRPGQAWSAADRALLAGLAEAECDRYEARGLTGKAVYWRRDRARLLGELDRFLDHDEVLRAELGARPLASELTFGLGPDPRPAVEVSLSDGRTVRFRGSADRVDRTAGGGLLVIDYKTGSDRDIQAGWEHETTPTCVAPNFQLPVYAARVARRGVRQ